MSNDVRWSMDLRWQSPKENYGFYDIADGIVFREDGKDVEKPDWETFLAVDRKEVWQKKYYKQVGPVAVVESWCCYVGFRVLAGATV